MGESMNNDLPIWLQDPRLNFVKFFEDDDDAEDDQNDDDDSEDDSEDDDEEDDDEDDKSKSKSKKKSNDDEDDDNSGLKSALKKERLANRELKRQLRAAQKAAPKKPAKSGGKQQEIDPDEVKEAARLEAANEAKQERLAAKLATNAVDVVIIKSAGKLKFKDVDDALKLISRKAVEVDQDDEDPTDIEVDEDSVLKALKKLAKDKPHLIVTSESDDEGDEDDEDDEKSSRRRSASSSVGRRGKSKSKNGKSEADLHATYPALGLVRHSG